LQECFEDILVKESENPDDLLVQSLSGGKRFLRFEVWSQFLELVGSPNSSIVRFFLKYNIYMEDYVQNIFDCEKKNPCQVSFFEFREKKYAILLLDGEDSIF
jgi:hypothetical protein